MGSEWEETTVADLMNAGHASLQTGPFGTALKAAEYAAEGVPLISVREIRHGYFKLTEHTPFVNEKTLNRLPKFILRQGDIVFGRKGAVDRSAMVQKNQDGWFLGSDGIRLRLDGYCDHRFISYQVRGSAIKNWLRQHAEGTTMLSMNQKVLGRIPLILPPLPEQKIIAHILGSLDDKIELNRRMNATLEGMAQALFKSWFVDFDPVIDNAIKAGNPIPEELAERAKVRRQALADGIANREATKQFPAAFQLTEELGWIPDRWIKNQVKDVLATTDYVANGSFAALKANVTLSDDPDYALYIRTTDYKNGFSVEKAKYVNQSSFDFLKKSKLTGNEVIISNVGDTGTVFRPPRWLKKPMTLGSNAIALKSKEYENFYYHYFISNYGQHQISGIVGGSAQPKFNKTDFRSLTIFIPSEHEMQLFKDISQSIRAKIEGNLSETVSLKKLRDTLLPKLISGELRIPEAEKLTEEALA